MTKTNKQTVEEKLLQIAQRQFSVITLDTRGRDCLDFHSVSVWGIKQALEEAFKLGFNYDNS